MSGNNKKTNEVEYDIGLGEFEDNDEDNLDQKEDQSKKPDK